MVYDEERQVLKVSGREFVTLCRRGVCASLPADLDEPEILPEEKRLREKYFADRKRETLYLPFEGGAYRFEVCVNVDCLMGDDVCLLCLTGANPSHPPKSWISEMRGEGYLAAYTLATLRGLDRVNLRLYFVNPDSDAEVVKEETVTYKKLSAFFEKCKIALLIYAPPAIDRATVRLPFMKKLAFPFSSVRDGQDAFMASVHRAVARGLTLYAEAPTGIGKTVSVLYPAIRAMGEGKCEKVFYFTPKTTTAIAARDCLMRFTAEGKIRGVIITAKEKICVSGMICKTQGNCPYMAENRLADAVLALYGKNLTVAEEAVIREVAAEFRVCPYELSLSYAELCDVVICDFNYLFDPSVYLRRFFTERGSYAFLIDEAHNLPDRASGMYSDEFTDEDFDIPLPVLGEHSRLAAELGKSKEWFCKLLLSYLKENMRKDEQGNDISSAHGSRLPGELFPLFCKLKGAVEGELFDALKNKSADAAKVLNDFYYKIRKFCSVLDRFDSCYEYFMFLENGKLRLKLFCIDTGNVVRERLKLGSSAVFFSGTLSPMEYYKRLLGGDSSSMTLSVESPFDREQLSVSIMDKISLRTSERERTLPAVLRVIAATVSAKRGNYMVFSPSFAYNEKLAEAFRQKYPRLRVIVQKPSMSAEEKQAFLAEFSKDDPSYLVAFCVMGGVYSEGIDLCGDALIGAVVVGVGLPSISFEREAMCAYFDEKYEMGKQYAYVYPGMNKVLQAAGRVIRRETDRGVIVLIDDRFDDPVYKKAIPALWHGLKFVADAKGLKMLIDRFWAEKDAEREP
ncbi:MAG: ATP-dependent DNA helicase [Clostridia bacterium]|nr:ATP-dependent DNA helicase [Clostridia bacterium]